MLSALSLQRCHVEALSWGICQGWVPKEKHNWVSSLLRSSSSPVFKDLYSLLYPSHQESLWSIQEDKRSLECSAELTCLKRWCQTKFSSPTSIWYLGYSAILCLHSINIQLVEMPAWWEGCLRGHWDQMDQSQWPLGFSWESSSLSKFFAETSQDAFSLVNL